MCLKVYLKKAMHLDLFYRNTRNVKQKQKQKQNITRNVYQINKTKCVFAFFRKTAILTCLSSRQHSILARRVYKKDNYRTTHHLSQSFHKKNSHAKFLNICCYFQIEAACSFRTGVYSPFEKLKSETEISKKSSHIAFIPFYFTTLALCFLEFEHWKSCEICIFPPSSSIQYSLLSSC